MFSGDIKASIVKNHDLFIYLFFMLYFLYTLCAEKKI
jgi:hypothetical protein